MKFSILGTGMVGETLATALIQKGHEVIMGSRTEANEKALQWAKINGKNASATSFFHAAKNADIIFNSTLGSASLDALKMAGEKNLENKILIDTANPLDFSQGMPPSLFISNTNSLGEKIQQHFPKTKVVKAFNTMACTLMVNPQIIPQDHNLFIAGNDDNAKEKVKILASENFGWKRENIIDVGDITSARATESLLPIWLRLWGTFQTPHFNFSIVKEK